MSRSLPRPLVCPLLLLLAGCGSTAPRLEAPDALAWGGPLAEARQGAGGQEALEREPRPPAGDAEAHLARGWTSSSLPARPPAPGHACEPDPDLAGPDLSGLLAARPHLRVPGRLAVIEAHRPCERLVVPAWGEPRLEATGQAWALRPPLPAALGALRAGLDPLRAAEAGQEWPALEAPQRDPFAAIDAVPGLLLPRQASLGAARRAAARIGADTLLITTCAARVYAWRSGWANLYPTLVGLLLPGEERAAVVRAEGALVDVRTGAILAVAQAEARRQTCHAPLLGGGPEQEQDLVEAASVEAVEGLASELRRALAGLEASGRFTGGAK